MTTRDNPITSSADRHTAPGRLPLRTGVGDRGPSVHARVLKGRSRRLVSMLAVVGLVGCFGATSVTPARAEAQIRTIGCGATAEMFNTGYNLDTKGALGTGSLDLAWLASGPFQGSVNTGLPTTWSAQQVNEITADPTSASGGIVFTEDLPTQGWTQAYVTSNSMVVPSGFSTASAVISQTANGRAILGWVADYAYMIQFNLAPEVAPSGVEILLTLLADNSVAAVYVNGIAQTGTHLPQSGSLDGRTPYDYSGYSTGNASIVMATGFKSGLNTILVQVKSSTTSPARPTTDQQFLKVSSQGVVVCNPVVVADQATTTANASADVAVMDNDGNLSDGAKVSQVVPDDPDKGSWTLNPADNTVSFAPARDFVGTATAVYTVVASDGTTVLGTAPITVTVNPSMGPDVMMTSPGVPVSVSVSDNDIVWPGSVVSDVTGDDPDQGQWSVTNGVVRFTPADGFAGTATATYTVTGPDGQTATSTVSAQVLGLSLVASRTPERITAAGQQVEFRYVLTNTGAPVSGAELGQGEFTGSGTPSALSCTYDADGSRATNGAIQLGSGESVTCVATYAATQADLDAGGRVSDAMTASAHGSLGAGSPAVPVTSGSKAAGADVGQDPELSVDVDTLPVVATKVGDPVWFEVTVSNTGNVTMTGVGVGQGLTSGTGGPVTVGACTYNNGGAQVAAGQIALAPGESAKCMVSYPVTQADLDGGGGVSFAATATGTDPNGASVPAESPPAQTKVVGVFDGRTESPWNTPVGVDVLAGIQNVPDGSTLTSIAAAPGDRSQDSWWAINPNTGQVVFTPPPSFSGVANGVVTVTYPDGSTGTQPVSVTVRPPTVSIQGVTETTPESSAVVLSPQITAPAGSTLTASGDPAQGTWTVNQADRTVTFTPKPGFTGPATATLTVTAPDGTAASAQASVSVTQAPAVDGTSVTVPKGTPAVLRPSVTVPDGSVIQVVGDPSQGTWTLNPDNTVTFTPAPGFTGTATATMTITGPDGMTDTAQLRVTVSPTPIVEDASATASAGHPVTLTPQIIAPTGSRVTVEGDPAEGTWTVNPDNTITFTPAPGFTGTATAIVTVTAPDGTTDTALLDVEVTSATNLDGATPTPSATPQGGGAGDSGDSGNSGTGPLASTGGASTGPAGLAALVAIVMLVGAATAVTGGVRHHRPTGASHA